MSILNKDVIKNLEKQSQDALGIFKKTVNTLQTINDKIDVEIDKRAEQRLKLVQEEKRFRFTKIFK